MPKGGAASDAVGRSLGLSVVQAVRTVGGYLAALVGTHRSTDVLDLLTDEWEIAFHRA